MSERFVSGVSAKITLYKYSSFPFPSSLPVFLPAPSPALEEWVKLLKFYIAADEL